MSGSQRPLPRYARAVILGGGIAGCSIAYHLAKLGWTDIVLLERKRLTSGTTWHAAGLIGQLRATRNMTRIAQYSAQLYAALEQETGQATGFRQCGSVSVAVTAERLEELRRSASMAKTVGVEVHEVGPSEIKSLWPLINIGDILGGVYLPKDGKANPVDTTMSLAKGAMKLGAKIFENTPVQTIRVEGQCAKGVVTDRGEIAADVVILATGMWSQGIGHGCGVNIPLQACEHFYIVTEKIAGLPHDLPVLRDPDHCSYFKEDAGKLLLGAFETNAKPWAIDGIPHDFEFGQLPEDLEHFAPILEKAIRRVPALEKVGIRTFFNGPESFTPDVRYLLGETPEVRGLYVATGFNSTGIQSAGGAGKVLAEWIVNGYAPLDLWDVDVRRMQYFQNNRRYLVDRVSESLGLLYAMHWPYRQVETARGVRTTPFHERLAARGACFGESGGWERANWFAPDGTESRYSYSYKRQNWFPHAAAEHKAVRKNVALFDLSSFAKFLVQGRDAEVVLQRICANDVAVEAGRIVYTQWLNERGGIEADLTVTRLSETVFLIVTSAASSVRDFNWLKRNFPDAANVIATDVTSGSAVLGLMGPNSRTLLSKLSTEDLSNKAFPFGTSREIEIGYAKVRASRISYVGELGWELYIPAEFARNVFDTIMGAGEAFGLKLAGMHAMDSCRIEKAYRSWGHDISDEYTPIEAGLMFAVRLNKSAGFTGREALLRLKGEKSRRCLLQFALREPEQLLYHDEPIFRDGSLVGYTTSANFGHSLGCPIALGYVELNGESAEHAARASYEIEVAGSPFAAFASLSPMFDPTSSRIHDT